LPQLLLHRTPEREEIGRVLDAARAGHGAALVLRGEPGMGKTVLLDDAAGAAEGLHVLRVTGSEAETDLPYAGVQQLVAPLLGDLDALPEPQRRALESALGLAAGDTPSRLHVNLAVAGLLADAAPALCVVDDAHWLDAASFDAIAFVARRLDGIPVALLIAVREPAEPRLELRGLPTLRIQGLAHDAARELLRASTPDYIAGYVVDLIVRGAAGNPFALLELGRSLTQAQLGGASSLPDPLPVRGALEQTFVRRVRRLPAETKSLLLLLAADPLRNADALWRAAAKLGLDATAADAAAADGLVSLEPRLEFRHAFLGAAVYGAARPEELRATHRALAVTTDRLLDPDGYAWHHAATLNAPDEQAAVDLLGAASRALTWAARAADLGRAAELTLDIADRAERTLAAAQAEHEAGANVRASNLLEAALPQLGDGQRADGQRLRRALDYDYGRVSEDAVGLLAIARDLEPLDGARARIAHLDALVAAISACRLSGEGGVRTAALAALAAPIPRESSATDFLLTGFATLFTDGPATAAVPLRNAVQLLRRDDDALLIGLGALAAMELWDDAAAHDLTKRQVDLARGSGGLSALPRGLNILASCFEIVTGRFDAADMALQEARDIRAATAPAAAERAQVVQAMVDAWRGREASTRANVDATIRHSASSGQGIDLASAGYALTILEMGLGHYPAAFAAVRDGTRFDTLRIRTSLLPELVEAAVRVGEQEVATDALERLAESTLAVGTHWGLGVLARSRALLADGNAAEALYLEAIGHLQQCRVVPELARANLLYGEWLRRVRRRLDARGPLRAAHEIFRAIGAEAFDERARIELVATGERVLPRAVDTLDRLTPHELRIARLVAAGASNPEIALELAISRRTVEYHLRKIFRKLGISSRTQMSSRLANH
jgi:DNA-binding CsgD family transcriptional regulator